MLVKFHRVQLPLVPKLSVVAYGTAIRVIQIHQLCEVACSEHTERLFRFGEEDAAISDEAYWQHLEDRINRLHALGAAAYKAVMAKEGTNVIRDVLANVETQVLAMDQTSVGLTPQPVDSFKSLKDKATQLAKELSSAWEELSVTEQLLTWYKLGAAVLDHYSTRCGGSVALRMDSLG